MPIKTNARFTGEQRDFVPCACEKTLELEDIKSWTVTVETSFQTRLSGDVMVPTKSHKSNNK